MNSADGVVAAEGVAPNGDVWALRYRPDGVGGRHEMAFHVNGSVVEDGSGYDIPGTTEIGFGGGFKPGNGNRYIYGLVTSRIAVIRAEGSAEGNHTDAPTVALSAATADDGSPLRCFVLVRPPVDDVDALVGLDSDKKIIQRISFIRP